MHFRRGIRPSKAQDLVSFLKDQRKKLRGGHGSTAGMGKQAQTQILENCTNDATTYQMILASKAQSFMCTLHPIR